MARQLLAAGEEVGFLGLLDPTPREGMKQVKIRNPYAADLQTHGGVWQPLGLPPATLS